MSEPLQELPALSARISQLARYDVLKDIPVLEVKVLGNTLYAYLLTTASFFAIWLILRALRSYLVRKIGKLAERHPKSAWAFARTLVGEVKPYLLWLLAFYFSTKRLELNATFERATHLVTMGLLTIQLIQLAGEVVRAGIAKARGGDADDPVMRNTTNNITTLVIAALWVAGGLFFLQNEGYNVTAFIGGLGIGAVAIALAAQAILGDTFSSFAISLDKPFEPGDYIVVDSHQGTVEHIGLKTTRVRSLSGEMLIFANSDLTKSRIRNFKRMEQRRATFKIQIHPETPISKVKRFPGLLKSIVEAQADLKFGSAAFTTIAEVGFVFEVVYTVLTADWDLFLKIQQAINEQILERCAQEQITLSFNMLNAVAPQE